MMAESQCQEETEGGKRAWVVLMGIRAFRSAFFAVMLYVNA